MFGLEANAAAANYGRGAAGSTKGEVVRPVNPSAFGTVEHAHDSVRNVSIRLAAMVDRLCGSYPEGTSADKSPAPDGLLGVATLQAVDIARQCESMNAALDRLEKQLP